MIYTEWSRGNACFSNGWYSAWGVGRELVDSSDIAVSVAMGHWNVEHRVFAVEQFFLEIVIP